MKIFLLPKFLRRKSVKWTFPLRKQIEKRISASSLTLSLLSPALLHPCRSDRLIFPRVRGFPAIARAPLRIVVKPSTKARLHGVGLLAPFAVSKIAVRGKLKHFRDEVRAVSFPSRTVALDDSKKNDLGAVLLENGNFFHLRPPYKPGRPILLLPAPLRSVTSARLVVPGKPSLQEGNLKTIFAGFSS